MRHLVLISILGFLASSCGPDQLLGILVEEADARVPNIKLATPAEENEAADTSYTIKATFDAITVRDTWNLYYVSNATPNQASLIATNLPVTNRTIAWDTSQMPSGNYFFYGELNVDDAVITATSKGSVQIDHSSATNASPSVTVTAPNGGESYSPGDTVSIAWNGSDGDSDTLTADIHYSNDDGNSWTLITSGESGSTYSWDVDADQAQSLSYRIRVTLTDPSEATASDISNSAFTIL